MFLIAECVLRSLALVKSSLMSVLQVIKIISIDRHMTGLLSMSLTCLPVTLLRPHQLLLVLLRLLPLGMCVCVVRMATWMGA